MNKTKELTLILPANVDYIDVTYYWKFCGNSIKTMVAFDGKDYNDGDAINCYSQPKEET